MLDEIQISRGTGGDAVVLADGDPWGRGVVEEISLDGEALLDVVTFLNAVGPTIFDRSGRTNKLRFQIFREQPRRTAVLERVLREPLRRAGVAALVLSLVEGGVTYTFTAAGAGWSPIGVREYNGYSSMLEFTVTCGPFTTPFFGADGSPALLGEDGTPLKNEDGTPLING